MGKLADLVLWDPAFFGVRPHVVLKGGMIAWAQMGDANASIPTPQPSLPRPMFGASPAVAAATSVTFVAPDALERRRWPTALGLGRRVVAVRDTRSLGKADMVDNDALPRRAGRRRHVRRHHRRRTDRADPATELPMAQRYFLF